MFAPCLIYTCLVTEGFGTPQPLINFLAAYPARASLIGTTCQGARVLKRGVPYTQVEQGGSSGGNRPFERQPENEPQTLTLGE